ncbi:phage capsid protein [Paludibacterium paludis]|uniref:Phage capsid protein n=2 Tax=Paludibacterium paludis TaxID=1225769 RepID=A0A918U7M9_9NEIS|nr:phage capsid protein [Paludibacterium paludis]
MAGKSKAFCVATEGATTDGRIIERSWITQMAANYDPKVYGARVNLEHIKGYTPDSPFKRYGDVLSLSTKDGDDGKLRLYAVIDPTEELIAMTKSRQKVYTSIEVNPKFADTGEAYLVGLAVTDDPASLGTEMLTFASTAKSNPLAARKIAPENLISEAIEFTLEIDTPADSLLEGFSNKIKGLISGFKKTSDSNFSEIQTAIEIIADSQRELLEKFSQIKPSPDIAPLQAQLTKLSDDHHGLVKRLSEQPATETRTLTAGGNGSSLETDC